MDVRSYHEIQDLFHTTWDPAILDVLADGPFRFLALARRVRERIDAGLTDGSINRSLARLRGLGLIRRVDDHDEDGRTYRVYEITAKGRHQLAAYYAIIEAYRRTHGGCAG